MRLGRCPDCKKIKFLTKHSLIGSHIPPYILLCRDCHNNRHGIKLKPFKANKKYARGTKRQHKK